MFYLCHIMWCFWAKISLLKGVCKQIFIYVICKEHIYTVHGTNALTTWLFSCRWKDESEWCFWPVDLHDDTAGQFTDCPSSDLEGSKRGTKDWTDENHKKLEWDTFFLSGCRTKKVYILHNIWWYILWLVLDFISCERSWLVLWWFLL